jgi:hypothetical protein
MLEQRRRLESAWLSIAAALDADIQDRAKALLGDIRAEIARRCRRNRA